MSDRFLSVCSKMMITSQENLALQRLSMLIQRGSQLTVQKTAQILVNTIFSLPEEMILTVAQIYQRQSGKQLLQDLYLLF